PNNIRVSGGAALELELQSDNIFGMITNPKLDSVTGTVNSMIFDNELTLRAGTGIGGTGALHSISGINTWSAPVQVDGSAAIGVDPDPNPSNNVNYFTKDYSLTVNGLVTDYIDPATGNRFTGNLVKVD